MAYGHRDFGHLFLGSAVFVPVPLRDQRIIRRHQRAVRHFKLRMRCARFGHGLHRRGARLVGQQVLPGHAQHGVALPGGYRHRRVMNHRRARCARQIKRGQIRRLHAEKTRHHAARHVPRLHSHRRGYQAVDILERQARIVQRGARRIALQLQCTAIRHFAAAAFTNAGDARFRQCHHGVRFNTSRAISMR